MAGVFVKTAKCIVQGTLLSVKNVPESSKLFLTQDRNYNFSTLCDISTIHLTKKSNSLDRRKVQNRSLFTGEAKWVAPVRHRDRGDLLRSLPKADEGIDGEAAIDLDAKMDGVVRGFGDIFPDENTPNKLFGGVRFADLPVLYIRVSKNNTIMALYDASGKGKVYRTCGIEGFKNAKKGTNIAAQTTAITFGNKVTAKGINEVKLAISGLGPGRMSAVKGLTMVPDLNIVSVSDVTPIAYNITPRPRKQKKR